MPLLSTEMSYLGFLLLLRCQSPLLLFTAVLDGLILNAARNAAGRHLRQFMENNRFPCRDTKTSRRAWIRVRPSQDHRFSPFLASVTKALAQNAQTLLSSLFPWLVSVSTRKSLTLEPFVSLLARPPAASRVRSEKKQCLHMWTEKMLRCGKELPGSQRRRAESQLSSPGAAETDGYTGGHHCPPSTRVAVLPSPCGIPVWPIRNAKKWCS